MLHLVATVRDGGESLIGQDGERDAGQEPTGRCAVSETVCCWLEAESGSPDRNKRENQYATNLENSRDLRYAADHLITGNIYHESQDNQSDCQQGNEYAALDAKQLQRVRTERAGDQAFIDDHRERHQQGGASGHGRRAVSAAEYHRDAAGARILVGDLDIGIGAEAADDGCREEGERKQVACKFSDLTGQGKDAGTDHHARPHGDGARQRQ